MDVFYLDSKGGFSNVLAYIIEAIQAAGATSLQGNISVIFCINTGPYLVTHLLLNKINPINVEFFHCLLHLSSQEGDIIGCL